MLAKTMGIVLVACLAASVLGVPVVHDDVGLHADQLGRQLRESIIPVSFRPSVLDGDVLALNMAEFTELLPECV